MKANTFLSLLFYFGECFDNLSVNGLASNVTYYNIRFRDEEPREGFNKSNVFLYGV